MPDEIVTPAPVAAAPEPTPPPAPPPAPVEDAAPAPTVHDPTPDARTQPPSEMWQSILDQTGTTPRPIEAEPDPLRPAKEAQEPWRRPSSAAPGPGVTPPAPKQWAGRYESPEALETAYAELQQARDRAETERQRQAEHAERLERLLAGAMGGGPGVDPAQWARAQAPPPPAQGPHPMLQGALQAIQVEAERLALGDPQGDPLRLVRAVALASQLDQESRRVYVDSAHSEVQERTSAAQQIQQVQTRFFEEYPDLKTARPSLLRQVAIEAEDELRQTRRDYGSAAYMRAWFDETAKQARASIRVGDGPASTPTGRSAARPPAASGSARPRSGAPFAETPTPRAQEPVLSGQDVHLARVFGRP
jgi:hypothetical protein